VDVALPGKSDLIAPARSVFIPKAWEGRYRIRVYLEGQRYQIMGVTVNGEVVRRGTPHDQPNDMDITALVRYGADNRIGLPVISRRESWEIAVIRLDLYPEGK
jgi:hypothetical protein